MPSRTFYTSPKLSDYLAYIKALLPDAYESADLFSSKCGVPYIEDIDHIACYLGISPSLIRQILHHPRFHYSVHQVHKKSGGERTISAPRTYLKAIQWWILDNVFANVLPNEYCHGFTRGRSYITNAQMHFGARHVLNVDIKEFFDHISESQIRTQFLNLGYGEYGASLLASLTTLDGRAPTGAPTSPQLGNMVLSEFDHLIAAHLQLKGLKYTRYADDLTISGQEYIQPEVVNEISDALRPFGFELNEAKTKFMGRGERIEVTGLTINDRIAPSRSWLNRVRGLVNHAIRRPEDFLDTWQELMGIYGVLVALDPARDKRLTIRCREAIEVVRALTMPAL